jgi:hypothetical protein
LGIKIAVAKAGVKKPEGGKYSRRFAVWIRANGFADIAHSARNCLMAIAANVMSWLNPEVLNARCATLAEA